MIGSGLDAPSPTGSYQLVIGSYILGDGSAIAIKPRANSTAAILFQNAAGTNIAAVDTTNAVLDVIGTLRADALRLDVTPTAETITPTHTFTISLNGISYKVQCAAA